MHSLKQKSLTFGGFKFDGFVRFGIADPDFFDNFRSCLCIAGNNSYAAAESPYFYASVFSHKFPCGSGEKFVNVSPDGKWVVYTAFQDWTLWKVSIEGGEPVQIAKSYARQSAISPDGRWIVYMASENNRHIVMPFEGGWPVRTIDLPPDAPQLQTVRWSPDSQFLQFIVKRGGVENIWQQPLDGGPPKQVTNFTSDRIFSYDWSHDGKTLAVIHGAWTADMVLLSQKQ